MKDVNCLSSSPWCQNLIDKTNSCLLNVDTGYRMSLDFDLGNSITPEFTAKAKELVGNRECRIVQVVRFKDELYLNLYFNYDTTGLDKDIILIGDFLNNEKLFVTGVAHLLGNEIVDTPHASCIAISATQYNDEYEIPVMDIEAFKSLLGESLLKTYFS